MAGFDPDAYLASAGQSPGQPPAEAFNPDAYLANKFGTDEYVNALAKKHGVAPDYIQGLTNSQTSAAAVHGVPILGGLAQRAEPYIGAISQPLVGGSAEGATVGERAAKNKALMDELRGDFQKQHPAANMASEMIGGTLATLPLASTALGAHALGLTGSLPGMIARGAASNAMISAADAATRGGGVGDIASSAGLGSIIGAGAPVVGRAVSAAATPLINTVRGIMNPADEAARRVAGAVSRDATAGTSGMSQPEFAAAQQAGAPVTLMERGGETTRALARSAANTSPEGRDILNRAIGDRFEGQGDRITGYLNSTFHYPDAAAQQAALESTARSVNNRAYGQAMQEGSGGLWSPTLERLAGSKTVADAMKAAADVAGDEAIVSGHGAMNPRVTFNQSGVMQFGRNPQGMPTYPDLQFWDLTRRQLSDQISAAQRAGHNDAARRLTSFANTLNTELDRMVPSYKAARQGAAQAFGAQDALEAGQKFVTSKMDNDAARQALAKMSPTEKQLFQDGFVSNLIQKIRETPDRRNVASQIANSPAAVERLNMALGRNRAQELQAMLHVENVMDLARPAVQGNSTTARQLAELGLAGGAYAAGSGGNLLNPDPTSVMSAALVYGAARGRHVIDTRVAQQVAQMLTSRDPAQLARGMRLLGQTPRLFNAIQNTDAALASIAARSAQPALTH